MFIVGSWEFVKPVADVGAYAAVANDGMPVSLETLLIRLDSFRNSEPMPLSLVKFGGKSSLGADPCNDFGSVRSVTTSFVVS